MTNSVREAVAERPSMDWHGYVLGGSADGLRLIEALARRRFNTGVLADEAATFVLDRLAEDDWARCARFAGRAQARTYLQTLVVNLLEEFSRSRFGRPRPPAWLARQGELWVRLWKELCLERQPLPALLNRYAQGALRSPDWVRQVALVIKGRIPRCGEARFDANAVEDIAAVADRQGEATPQAECGSNFEVQAEAELLVMLRAVLQEAPSSDDFAPERAARAGAQAERFADRLSALRDALALSDEEIVMLRMIFCDGLSKRAVSHALGLPAHRAGLTINALLGRIRDAVAACDLDLNALLAKV